MEDKILIEAKKHISDPDIIIDMFDLTICWISGKNLEVMGIPKSKIIGTSANSFLNTSLEKARLKNKQDLMSGGGISEYPAKTKKGNFLMKFKYKIFIYDEVHYYVGKLVSFEPY